MNQGIQSSDKIEPMLADPQHHAYAHMLISRLERLSVDSYWAHRSSGVRGALIRALDRVEVQSGVSMDSHGLEQAELELDKLIKDGAHILEEAAREIRVNER